MSTYTNNSTTRPRLRDRARNQMKKFKSAVSSALPSVTSSLVSSEFDRHPRVWESLVTAGIVALFTLNAVFLYPLVYGGFLNVIYPPWTAPKPFPADILNIKSPNVLRSIIDRLNEVTAKFTKFCYTNNKLSDDYLQADPHKLIFLRYFAAVFLEVQNVKPIKPEIHQQKNWSRCFWQSKMSKTQS